MNSRCRPPGRQDGRWSARTVLLLLALGPWMPFPASAAETPADPPPPLRVGCFPNVTHAQALVGRSLRWFEDRVGVPVDWKTFNAGPSAMEALLTGALDLAYVGPNPAINAYVRSKSQALRVVAGVTSGGASLIVRKGAAIRTPEDFRGKRVACPQLGNTQDVALRHWLREKGLILADKGGDVRVLPVQNPDTLTLFLRGDLDAAWVPEPWASRLVREGGGERFLDERDLWEGGRFCTALLVARSGFLDSRRDVAGRFVAAHAALTAWIREHPAEARRLANEQFARLAGKPLPEEILESAFAGMEATWDPLAKTCEASARRAWDLGYLPGKTPPDLGGLFDLSLLNRALREQGRKEVASP